MIFGTLIRRLGRLGCVGRRRCVGVTGRFLGRRRVGEERHLDRSIGIRVFFPRLRFVRRPSGMSAAAVSGIRSWNRLDNRRRGDMLNRFERSGIRRRCGNNDFPRAFRTACTAAGMPGLGAQHRAAGWAWPPYLHDSLPARHRRPLIRLLAAKNTAASARCQSKRSSRSSN
jgi:hypothetical protein